MKITQYRLAKAIGVDARRIHAIVHGERSITAETALLLSRFFRKLRRGSGWGCKASTTWKSPRTAFRQRLSMVAAHSPD